MLQIRKKLLVAVLCSAMALTMSQSVAWSEASESEAVQTETVEQAAEETEAAEEPAASISEADALAQCELFASNDALELYVNKSTGAFAVKVKANGYCWWSNPFNADNDPAANNSKKEELKSAITAVAVKVTDTEAPSTTIRAFKDSVKGGNMTVEKISNGVRLTYTFPNEGITIPVEVVLDGDHFNASILVDQIYEEEGAGIIRDSSRSVVNVNLFQDLGAGTTEENGYIVTPDGSGAVINFNNGKTNANEYTQRIYGRDLAISQDMAPKKTEQAYLPILGIVKEDCALLEVVTEGSAYATARAAVSGQRATSYNSAWFNFILRSTDSYYMGGQNASALNSYEQNLIPEPRVTVSYYPIAKSGATYVDIAQRYQKYLLDSGMMTKKTQADQLPFYLDIFGGTVKEQSVLGFPIKLETAATTYSQAKTIVEEFTAKGVKNIFVIYNDFNGAGITSRISNSLDISGTLGGKKDFEALKSYCDGVGAVLTPNVDLMEYERSGNGYSKTGASVIGVTKAYATQTPYELAYGSPHDTRNSWYILTPAYFEKVYGEVIRSYTSNGMKAISVDNGTNKLYSDFNTNASKKTSRQAALEKLKNCYAMINQSGLTFVSGAANDYALAYVDYLTDVPMYSSNFDVSDYDIPLYEMVIHGYIPYTTKAKNASSSADELFLLSVATGTPIHYEVMYQDPNKFTNCTYDELFYTNYSGWLETAVAEYKLMEDTIKGLSDKTITNFEYLDEYVVKTQFSDGTEITADLENSVLTVNGKNIDLADYGLKGATN